MKIAFEQIELKINLNEFRPSKYLKIIWNYRE